MCVCVCEREREREREREIVVGRESDGNTNFCCFSLLVREIVAESKLSIKVSFQISFLEAPHR